VRCRCGDDFERFKNLDENMFSTLEDQVLLNRALGRVGLCFRGDTINIEKRERWEEGPMKERVMTRMPTTTNSLEYSDEHLNEKTPSRTPFWKSMPRVVGAMLTKSTALWSCVQHDFADEVRESLPRAGQVG
jgi:hypothetical protein